jgi:hypothetical protein
MDDHPDPLDLLTKRLEALEMRVCELEHPTAAPSTALALDISLPVTAQAAEPLLLASAGGAFSVLGKAMLGIAGAYLLRAVAESTSLPKPAVAALAIAYAMLWLICATRTLAGAWFATITYASTSALILAPMLWELTLSFKVLTAVESAVVLCAFVGTASALAWKRNLTSIFWIANVTAATVAFALSIATHEMTPFIAALLLMALLSEYAAFRGHGQSVRPLVEVITDLAISVQFYIYASPQNERTDYPLLGTVALLVPSLTLFLICGTSVALKTAFFEQKISAFETLQATVTFLLLACSVLACAPHSGAIVLGAICLLLSAVGYASVIGIFCRVPGRRNERVFGAWSVALFLAGSVLCLPAPSAALCLAVAAIVASLLGVHLNRPLLQFHGAAYLIAAAVASGLLFYAFQAFWGTLPGAPAWSAYVVTVSAVFCYTARKSCLEVTFEKKLLDFVSALLAVSAMAAFLVKGLVSLAALTVTPAAHHIAFIRTLTICATVLALAFSGSHWRRIELTRIGYAALVLAAVKLILEDLRLGHLEFTAASIFLFAITLIAVPHVRFPERHLKTQK